MASSRRRGTVAAAVLLASGAACLLGVGAPARAAQPAGAAVVVGDRLGRRDEVDFYFPADAEGPVDRVRRAAADAGLPVRTVVVEDETDDGRQHLRLGTTLGRRTGVFSRTIPARTLQAVDVFGQDRVVLNLHPGARVAGSPFVTEENVFARRFAVSTSSDVVYRVPVSWLARVLAVLLVMVGLPLTVIGAWAKAVEGGHGDAVDKVHRLRVGMTLAFVVLPLITAVLVVIGGLLLLPDMLLSELAPAATQWRATFVVGPLAVFVFGMVVTDLAAYLGVQPVDRRLRGTDEGAAAASARMARGLLIGFVPLILWFTFVGLTPGAGPAARLGGLALFLVLFNALGPVLVLRSQETYRLDEPRRRRILSMCEAQGLRVRDVRAIRARSARVANAMITGVLPSLRYVLITDHLLDHLSEDELEAVVAHEIAHGRQHHLLFKAGSWLVLVVAVNVAVALPDPVGTAFAVLALPLLFGLFFVQGRLGIVLEERADDYACARVGVEPVIGALEKLAELNMTKRRTGAFWDALQQHPGIERRVGRLRYRTMTPGRAA